MDQWAEAVGRKLQFTIWKGLLKIRSPTVVWILGGTLQITGLIPAEISGHSLGKVHGDIPPLCKVPLLHQYSRNCPCAQPWSHRNEKDMVLALQYEVHNSIHDWGLKAWLKSQPV